MTSIDYMKILDTAVLALDISSQAEIQALDLTVFKTVLSMPDGTKPEIIMKVNKFDLELILNKNILEEKEFVKWLKKFEYQLEQIFFTNITISHTENKTEYNIKILY